MGNGAIPLVLGVFAGLAAVVDWAAVWAQAGGRVGARRVEYAAKPLVVVLLFGAALSLDSASPEAARWWVVAALVFSLAGDVLLMLPPSGRFEAGLASFLAAHLCYMGGFAAMGLSWTRVGLAAVVLVAVAAVIGPPVLRGAARGGRAVRGPVALYMLAISAMAALAVGTGRWSAAVGAGLFYESDAMIAWSRFVRPWPRDKVAIIVVYHAAQALLVVSLTLGT